jgi:hypothetical protein
VASPYLLREGNGGHGASLVRRRVLLLPPFLHGPLVVTSVLAASCHLSLSVSLPLPVVHYTWTGWAPE